MRDGRPSSSPFITPFALQVPRCQHLENCLATPPVYHRHLCLILCLRYYRPPLPFTKLLSTGAAGALFSRNRNRRNRNRNLETSKALLKSQAHQGTSLFTSAATNQRGVSKGGSREAQVRIPEHQEGTEELFGWEVLRWGGGMIRRVRVGEIEEMRF